MNKIEKHNKKGKWNVSINWIWTKIQNVKYLKSEENVEE